MKPRIFISAVTSELGATRQLVANVLLRLGYDPVTQDIFGTESGDLRQVLRDKIDDCDGLIQLVGCGYGAEPPTIGAEFAPDGFPRVSYTQFEFLYARARGKKTWLIYTDEGCTLDHPLEELDLPRDPTHPDPAGYQSERRALQEAWRQRWKQEGHLRHGASSDTELELKVERLKDEFTKMRRGFRLWQRIVLGTSVTAVLLLGCLLAGQRWLKQDTEQNKAQLAEIAAQLAALKPEEIKDQLRKTIEATYQQEVQEADKLNEWQKRDEAKRDAATARDKRLGQVDEFLTSITSTIKSGDASPEFLELTRIVQKEGVDQALAYITSQKSRLLERGDKLTAEKQRELHRTLAPLLQGIRLHRSKGKFDEARTLCDKLLKQDANWLDVLHEHCGTMIALGDRAQRYETIEVALVDFESAKVSAKRLVAADANNPDWLGDLSVAHEALGDVFLSLGRTDDALREFEEKLKIDRALVEANPEQTENQRNLSISFERLGKVFLTLGRTDDALRQFEEYSKICHDLAEADPKHTENQRNLAISFERLGEVFLTLGRTDDALRMLEKNLKLSRMLAVFYPRDAEKQRDLSVSFERLGKAFLTLGRTDDAFRQFEAKFEIDQALVKADPRHIENQRNLATSFQGLGDVFDTLGRTDDALRQYEHCLNIRRALAEADPRSAEKQRDLAASFGRLGDVLFTLGRTDDALRQYEDTLKITRALAEADPRNAQKQRNLALSHHKLGEVQVQLGKYDAARQRFQQGIAVLDAMIEKQLLVESATIVKADIEARIQFCQAAPVAIGDWDTLLKSDAKLLPDLLFLRAAELTKRGKLADVAQAGGKFRELEPRTKNNLYNAACIYAMCVTLVVKDKPVLAEADQAERKRFIDLSLMCLKESIAAGFDRFDHMKQDSDLNPLHGVPEFEALFPKKSE